MDELVRLYDDIKHNTASRSATLEQTLDVSEKFWDNLTDLAVTLKELQDTVTNQEPPGIELDTIREQQDTLEVRQWLKYYGTYDILLRIISLVLKLILNCGIGT